MSSDAVRISQLEPPHRQVQQRQEQQLEQALMYQLRKTAACCQDDPTLLPATLCHHHLLSSGQRKASDVMRNRHRQRKPAKARWKLLDALFDGAPRGACDCEPLFGEVEVSALQRKHNRHFRSSEWKCTPCCRLVIGNIRFFICAASNSRDSHSTAQAVRTMQLVSDLFGAEIRLDRHARSLRSCAA